MKNIIWGIGDLAECLYAGMQKNNMDIYAFCVDEVYKNRDSVQEKPVITDKTLDEILEREEVNIFLCVGYNEMNNVRKRIYENLKRKKNVHFPNFIDSRAICNAKSLGEGNIIFDGAYIGEFTEVGNMNIFFPRSMFAHHSIVGDYNFFAVSCSVAGHVNVGDNCFIGNNSTIKDKINISDYTLVGAGAYVKESTDKYNVVVPARSVVLSKDSMEISKLL